MIDTTTWLCGPPPATGRRQRYPSRFMYNFGQIYITRPSQLLSSLEMFCGESEWGAITTDIDPDSAAEVVAPYDSLPFEDGKFSIVLADPPYTLGFGRRWTDLEKDIPRPKRVLCEAARVTEVGGIIAILHVIVIPAYKVASVARIALHPILCGPNNAIRVLNVFRKVETD